MVKKFRIMHNSPLSNKPECIALALVHTWGALVTWTGGIPGCSIYFMPVDLTLIKGKQMVEIEEFTPSEQREIEIATRNGERYFTEYRKFEDGR